MGKKLLWGTVFLLVAASWAAVGAEFVVNSLDFKQDHSSFTEIDIQTQASDETQFIGNINSKIFHVPTCRTLPALRNRIYFSSRQEAIDQGFEPCRNCRP